jgi:P pilus assembly chaperone PapD
MPSPSTLFNSLLILAVTLSAGCAAATGAIAPTRAALVAPAGSKTASYLKPTSHPLSAVEQQFLRHGRSQNPLIQAR